VSSTVRIHRTDLNEQVYDELRRRLMTRRLLPNEKLSLHELAGELGVSRSPVHHALTRLVADGLLSVQARRGYFVTPLTTKVVLDAHDVREALELRAAEVSIGRVDSRQLARLRRAMEATLRHLDGERFVDRRAFIAANQAFHERQIDLAENPLMSDIYRRLSVNLLMERILAGRESAAGDVGCEHVEIVAAFESADLARAQRAIRAHVETGRQLALAALEAAGGVL
jgi:DNA-binding GntR family transcriptional regulator